MSEAVAVQEHSKTRSVPDGQVTRTAISGQAERCYRVTGGTPLRGEVSVRGAKNATLPIIAASLLTEEPVTLENVPDVVDVRTMLEVLGHLGAYVEHERDAGILRIEARDIKSRTTPSALAQRLRGSFLVMGPLLARFGQASAPRPGGCAIGARPVDVHSQGFSHLGAQVTTVDDRFSASGNLAGASFILDYPSHTGTENVIMAAVLAEGITVIDNASIEPEVLDLTSFLRSMGARIAWTGPAQVSIQGVRRLHGTTYRLMPDRLEAGTYLLAGAISGGDVLVRRCVPDHLRAVTSKLEETGVELEIGGDGMRVRVTGPLRAVDITTYPYPGFPTDLQQPFSTLLTQAEGESVVHETIFEGRLGFAEELRRLGADIEVTGQTAVVRGPTRLQGTELRAQNLRAGAAVVMAALAADGESTIHGVHQIERGYSDFVAQLEVLGADISVFEVQPDAVVISA
jgi:UDP-N-acetylglucosamine 1-carboxyvinyltransferase